MTCPKCHGEMRVYERSNVTIDQCTECRGIFLDRGELEKLFEAEATYNRQAQQPPSGPRPAQAPGTPGGYAPPPPPAYGGQPGYGQPGYGQPGYGQPGYGQPAYPPAAAAYGGHGPQYGQGYHGHYRQHGHHGHYRHRKSFLNQLFD